MEQGQGKFNPRPSHLYPVILSLGITGVLGYPFASQNVEVPSATPFEGGTFPGASLNALFFIVALAGSATVMVFLVRRGKTSLLRTLVKIALVVVSFSAVFWYSDILYGVLGGPPEDPLGASLLFTLSLAAALVLGFLIFGKGENRQLTGVVLVSALTGLFLGASIPPLTALVLAAALVVYDIVAVFRGPVGALAKTIEEGDLPGAVFSYRELTIGMGDMVFYSLLATTALINYGVVPFFAAGLGILAGAYLGFKALQKYEMFPGLPFSLVLGVVGMLLATWL